MQTPEPVGSWKDLGRGRLARNSLETARGENLSRKMMRSAQTRKATACAFGKLSGWLWESSSSESKPTGDRPLPWSFQQAPGASFMDREGIALLRFLKFSDGRTP